MTEPSPGLRQLAASTIRALALDATNAANSGHPGAPMGLADIAVVLWGEVMRFDPSDPDWENRDRFVLSNGHASMLLYSMLHLSGYELSLEDLRQFRQLGSKTPGHPEYGMTPGVETTTGPLGQGFANGIGMAIGARMMKARFGKSKTSPIDHHVFGICGDGCLMEGVASEAASLAGYLGLGEIVYVYDDNQITIDGRTDITFTEDVKQRFSAYGWEVLDVDGHDQVAIKAALLEGKAQTKHPTLIVAKTHIGFGSPNRQDKSKAHGEPMGAEETKLTKAALGWNHEPFFVPGEVRAFFGAAGERGKQAHAEWKRRFEAGRKEDQSFAEAWDAQWKHAGSDADYAEALDQLKTLSTATRGMSGKALCAISKHVTGLVGGSADLAGSNKSVIDGSPFVSREDFSGRNLHFGVREHGMAAVVNGLALYGGFVPYGATFLVFSDYMRPSLRLSALMKLRTLMVFTHDSIYLGEDGPTHQPVEQLWALRMIPGYTVWRPADGVETAMAWGYAAGQGEAGPHGLVFTRQNVPALDRPADFDPKTVWKGAYALREPKDATIGIVATGSEVHVALEAAATLEKHGIRAKVVSMPSLERFMAQDEAYRNQVLQPNLRWVSIELGLRAPWAAVTGKDGLNIGLDGFGESAPWEALAEHFGMTSPQIAERIRRWVG